MEVEEAITKLKFHGLWQILIYILINIAIRVPATWHMTSIFYLAYPPSHHCKIPDNASVNHWIPLNEEGKLSSCNVFVNSSINNQTIPCTNGWTFDTSESGPTIVTKWNFVCHRSYFTDVQQMFYSLGLSIGCIILTKPADTFGRKWVFLINSFLMSFFSLLTAFVDKIELLFLYKFLSGVFSGGSGCTAVVYLLECFSKENKLFYMANENVVWCTGLSILMFLTFLVLNWAYTEIIVDIYSIVFIFGMMWWLHDTVPWLHANNRIREAEEALLWAAKLNNVTFQRPILKQLDEEFDEDEPFDNQNQATTRLVNKEKYRFYSGNFNFLNEIKERFISKRPKKTKLKTHYSTLELVKNKYLLRHMSFGFILLIDNLTYFSSFNVSGLLSVNRYISGILHVILDVPACILMYWLCKKFGKKKPLLFMHFISIIPIFACVVTVSLKEQTDLVLYITLALNIIYKFVISTNYAVIYMYGSELFPTNLRNQANGICYFIGRMGLMVASYAPITFETFPKCFYVGLGLLSLLGGLLCTLLPETQNRSLPETIEDIEEWYEDVDGSELKTDSCDNNVDNEDSDVSIYECSFNDKDNTVAHYNEKKSQDEY